VTTLPFGPPAWFAITTQGVTQTADQAQEADIEVEYSHISPNVPAGLGPPNAAGTCDGVAMQGGAVPYGSPKSPRVCGRMKDGSVVMLEVRPDPGAAGGGTRVLVVTRL
jgi:hypothetical protein